jgi:hypothetical protein
VLGLEDRKAIEQFVLDELDEVSALPLPENVAPGEELAFIEVVGVTWRFRARFNGRHKELIELIHASEIGASLATELRDRSFNRTLSFSFARPKDAEITGQQLRLLLAEATDFQRQMAAQRDARATQRIFRVWRSYLRDRADLEAKRTNAIKYIDRSISGERVIFTSELAQTDELVGQERVVFHAGNRLAGEIIGVAFNQIMLNVTFGDPTRIPRRGELAINTIAAQRALEHQSAALNAVFYERAVNPSLKNLILDPKTARPVVEVSGVTPTDEDFDDEKEDILAKALGVQDFLTIEGPPGTGKTKLIAEIVVQWLKRNPRHRIMLTSQTHIALDNVLERITEANLSLEMIRIGRSDEPRISELGHKLLLERRVEAWIKEVRVAGVIPFGNDPDDLVSVEHHQRADVLVGHHLDRVVHRVARMDGPYLMTLMIENVTNCCHDGAGGLFAALLQNPTPARRHVPGPQGHSSDRRSFDWTGPSLRCGLGRSICGGGGS